MILKRSLCCAQVLGGGLHICGQVMVDSNQDIFDILVEIGDLRIICGDGERSGINSDVGRLGLRVGHGGQGELK